ncbi:MAG: MlaD family protein, partial [Firmicutes bacterium]|nr:MlaD family protein [Bacillota bacterium]
MKIGLFVTLTGIGTILYVMQTAEVVGTGRTYTIHAYVDDASGLLIDSNVRLAGVDIGRLTDIELDGSRARLTLEIRESVELYQDAVVAKATESLLGTATVSINPGTGVGGLLGDGDTVRNVQQSATISDAVGNANVLAANAAELVEEINTYFTDEGTIQALDEIVMVIREAAISTSALLEQNLLIARRTMQNIQSFSARLDDSSIQQLAA